MIVNRKLTFFILRDQGGVFTSISGSVHHYSYERVVKLEDRALYSRVLLVCAPLILSSESKPRMFLSNENCVVFTV